MQPFVIPTAIGRRNLRLSRCFRIGLGLLFGAVATPAQAEPLPPAPPCLTCPRPVPACWMVVYRWTDYNLRSGPGNYLLITDGPPPNTAEMAKALEDIRRPMPKGMTAKVLGTDRIACPEPAKPWR